MTRRGLRALTDTRQLPQVVREQLYEEFLRDQEREAMEEQLRHAPLAIVHNMNRCRSEMAKSQAAVIMAEMELFSTQECVAFLDVMLEVLSMGHGRWPEIGRDMRMRRGHEG